MAICRRLEGKVAIVTAATRGIGFAIAERLCSEGANVVICSRKQENVDDALKYLNSRYESKVEGLVCHVANTENQHALVDYTIKKFRRIDILVNNHGINPAFGHILDVGEDVWDKLFQVNVKAGWQLSKLVHPYMAKNGGGSIIFISSIAAYKSPPISYSLFFAQCLEVHVSTIVVMCFDVWFSVK
ncbi:oxidoreductase, short chain dehydrogenase/reductase family protein [Dictyocaulus viviparus]|uniref:Oxidoreductase, short chain dehydrogenase/reductase family protein n=1 Tax=Dictyocaulus viviparus TaxID=29172 RepID=A0A0D8XRH1_DICVI|nr:oxidoreductase, short chain dehydrogenase/reductase family protein [Dictyocaulus viviparus]